MTERLLRAIECPWVDVLGHPTGRLILRREPVAADWNRVIAAAVAAGVALEINGQADRRDLPESLARQARQAGAMIVISSDAHSPAALGQLRWGTHGRPARLADRRRRPEHRESGRRAASPAACAESDVNEIAEIRRLYFETTPATVLRDFDRAIDLLKSLKTEADRSKAVVYMEGLAALRKEWPGRRADRKAPSDA